MSNYANVQKALDALNVQHELIVSDPNSCLQWLQTGLMVGDYSLQILCPEDYYAVCGELRWSLQLFSFKNLEQLANFELAATTEESEVVLLALQLVFGTSSRLQMPWMSCATVEEVLS